MSATSRVKSVQLYKKLFKIFGVVFVLFSIIFQWNAPPNQTINYYALMYMILLSFFGIVLFIAVLYNVTRKPEELKVLILGPPHTGKTVFLNVMMKKLLEFLDEGLAFTFDDRHTLTMVEKNVNYLSSGQWLPSTNGTAVAYRLKAKVGTKMFHDFLKLCVVDVPFKPTVVPSEEGAPPTINYGDLKKTLKNYQAVVVIIDSQVVFGNGKMSIDELQDLYIPLIKELPRQGEDSQTPVPVAIVFTKTDMVEMLINPIGMRNLIPALLQTCKKECKNYRMFYTSSVGGVDEMNNPSSIFTPKNIIDPLPWIVKSFGQ